LFRDRVLEFLADAPKNLLDVGAGAGILEQMDFRGEARWVGGIDPDPRVIENPHLDEGREGVAEAIPYPDESFDVIIANNVLEHVPDPKRMLAEVHRVLRSGGVFLAKTPNRRHYVPLVAILTPHWFHERVNSLRGRSADDTFPTLYRANTPSAIEDLGSAVGFRVSTQLIESRPEYMRVHALTYLVGWAYERAVNFIPILRSFRVILLVEMKKLDRVSTGV
jgi:ubiquinone/menaquinone biosynthesis C-methylase UbiE